MKLGAAMTKTSPNDASCVAWVLLSFFLTIYTPIHRIILKHITLHYVDVEIKFDPLFTF